jgi:hypothetical protein
MARKDNIDPAFLYWWADSCSALFWVSIISLLVDRTSNVPSPIGQDDPVVWRGPKKTAMIRLLAGGFLLCFLLVGGTSNTVSYWSGLSG